jgi:acyl-CoA thioesterase
VTTRFDRDTAVKAIAAGRYEARIDRGWWVFIGPNGGYVGAILLRALEQAVDDPRRAPRSLSIHYTAPPREGPVQIETRVERAGRSLTTLSGRMLQQGRLVALALAAFSRPRPAAEFQLAEMPEVVPPERAPRFEPPDAKRIAIRERFDSRPVFGALPYASSQRAETGGWLRLEEPRRVDAALLVAMADGWAPAIFTHLPRGPHARGVPTVDLTVHFRASVPLPDAGPEDFTLATFRTRVLREGFLEEDGELWSRSGVRLAQSRQLAILT